MTEESHKRLNNHSSKEQRSLASDEQLRCAFRPEPSIEIYGHARVWEKARSRSSAHIRVGVLHFWLAQTSNLAMHRVELEKIRVSRFRFSQSRIAHCIQWWECVVLCHSFLSTPSFPFFCFWTRSHISNLENVMPLMTFRNFTAKLFLHRFSATLMIAVVSLNASQTFLRRVSEFREWKVRANNEPWRRQLSWCLPSRTHEQERNANNKLSTSSECARALESFVNTCRTRQLASLSRQTSPKQLKLRSHFPKCGTDRGEKLVACSDWICLSPEWTSPTQKPVVGLSGNDLRRLSRQKNFQAHFIAEFAIQQRSTRSQRIAIDRRIPIFSHEPTALDSIGCVHALRRRLIVKVNRRSA